MKAYGRNRQHHGNLPDNHPSKGYVNWWEAETPKVKNKKRERLQTKKEMRDIIKDIPHLPAITS